jgi:adenylate cyclase
MNINSTFLYPSTGTGGQLNNLDSGQLMSQLCPQLQQSFVVESRVDGLLNEERDAEQELAILFLDIRNFTGLMESRPAKEVAQVVRRLFSGFNQIIKHFSGTVIEIAGDSLYAVFGLGASVREAVNQGYQATKVIFETIDWFNHAYGYPIYNRKLEIGIGLYAGKVVVGQSGLISPEQLSIMGLPVNIASRLQAQTKELNNDMIISEEAYQHLEVSSDVYKKQTVRLPGVSLPQNVRLLGKPYEKSYAAEPNLEMDYLLAISG